MKKALSRHYHHESDSFSQTFNYFPKIEMQISCLKRFFLRVASGGDYESFF